jgi:hypothetical protein
LCDEGDPETLCYAAGAGERPPILQTREGEPIVTCTAVLEVGDPEVAAKVLDGCYEAKQAGWVEFFALGEDEAVLRAELRLEGCLLTVATHSEARLDRVLDVLAAELPDAVVVSDERVPLPPGEFPAAPSLLGADPPEAVKLSGSVVVELADRLERRWIDESVPALDGLTPRQAASDPTRVDELQRLIDSFPEPQPDGGFITLRPERLRRLLGLPSRPKG